jgi:mono/diheme cytochrome c family protein
MIIVATTARTVGYVIAAVAVAGFLLYLWATYRDARAEIGSEVELAPNRKPYYDDEELESGRLDRTLVMALGMLAVVAVGLPLYWLAEPGRMEDRIGTWDRVFIQRGEASFEERCAQCHGAGGVGGVASYTLTDADGQFVDQVEWKAPALDTVLNRYSYDEVTFILDYGRANTPMPAWGAPGGGPLTTQQIEELVAYLASIQLSGEEMQEQINTSLVDRYVNGIIEQEAEEAGIDDLDDEEAGALMEELEADRAEDLTTEVTDALAEGQYDYNLDGAFSQIELGEAMFNLGAEDGTAGGAYSCARCHTKGWAYGEPELAGGGRLGPNLTNAATLRQFPTFQEHVAFVTEGGEQGVAYGSGGRSGAGEMPGFGINPNAEDEGSTLTPEQFMYSQAQIDAVVAYERSL